MAVADFDGDGRLDLAINNNNNGPTIYRNQLARSGNWLALSLVGADGNRDAVGARLRLTLAASVNGDDGGAGKTLTRWVEAGSGYASQSAFPLHFGLGEASRIELIEITWPSGHVDRLSGAGIAINGRTRIEEGGKVAHISPVSQPTVSQSTVSTES